MLDVVTGFIRQLQAAGLPVSLTETIDSLEALRHVPVDDREAFRHALGATVAKTKDHRAAFDVIFDIYFAPAAHPGASPAGVLAGGEPALSAEQLAERLERALAGDDRTAVQTLARHAVTRYAGMAEGRPVGAGYYLYRTLRHLDLDGMLARLLASHQLETGEGDGTASLDRLIAAEDQRARLGHLRSEVESEIRRRLVAERGPQALAGSLKPRLPEDVDFMNASPEDIAALRRALHPLTRKLAARLAKRRRHGHRGPLHFRDTVRHSLSSGGVPVELRFRHARPAKPEIAVLADVSGSVASFSRFTLELVHAISWQFSKVRSFVFVDGIDEVTRFFETTEDLAHALRRVNTEADVVWMDGHSDYGHALVSFWERWGSEITPRTTVILLGDARNNYHAAEAWVMAELARSARHVYWLNPEPRAYWDTGDSILSQYAAHCDGAFECRNLRQLTSVVEQL